jgi:hypothetical protein
MPLSEQEQRLLDEMERHLMGNDADVVTAQGRALSYRNLVWGTLLVLVGLGGLIIGVASDLGVASIIIGVVGFLIMLGGVVLAVTPLRGAARAASPTAPRAAKTRSTTSFMDRMNDRWDRRNGDE